MFAQIKSVLRAVIFLGSLAFIIHFFIDNEDGLALIGSIKAPQVLTLMFLCAVQLGLFAIRLRLVIEKCSQRRIAHFAWFRIFIISRFLNTIVPQSGNVYRALRLKSENQISYTEYIAGVASFTWLGTWLNFVIALAVIATTNPGLTLGAVKAWHITLAAVVGLTFGPFIIDFVVQRLRFGFKRLNWIHAKVNEVIRTSLQSLRDVTYMAKFLVVSFAMFAIFCAIFFVCFESLGIKANLSEVVLFYVLMQLMTYFVITPGNLGIQELTFGILGAQLGIGMAQGILVSALLRIVIYVVLYGIAVPLGGLAELRRSKSSHDGAAGP